MSPNRILVVTQDFPPETGGVQSYLFELARHFHSRGQDVTVVCPGSANTPSPLPPDVKVIRVNIPTSWLFLPLMFRLPRILREGGFSHVVYAQWQGVLSEILLPRSAKKHQSLCLVCGRELLTSVLIPFHGILSRWTFRRVNIAVPISRAVEALLRERIPATGRIVQVHPGVDPNRFHPVDAHSLRARYGLDDGPVVMCIARMVHRKGMDLLIKAFSDVLKQAPTTWLVLGGDGPEAAALRNLALELGIADRVRFVGRISDSELALHYSLASVFALPTRQSKKDVEGFGIVYLEAGGCEVPVIGTRTGGVMDAVEENVTGLLIPQEDIEALTAALTRLLKNPEEARQMGRSARQRILRELTWKHTGDAFLELMNGA